jgi:starch synthase
LRVLFVSSEAYPLIKTGGLADVSGSLPAALKKSDVDIKLLIPGYPAVLEKVENQHLLGSLKVFTQLSCEIIAGTMPNSTLEVIVIKNKALYERDGGPYINALFQDWDDNPLRFGVLSKVASILSGKNLLWDWLPDIVHCNDWQTGLIPYYIKQNITSKAKTILSIHNLAFQGNCEAHWVSKLELNPYDFQLQGYEFYGQLSFLKAGLFYADKLSTVSPNYAKEIQTDAFGFGLQGLLQIRKNDITGILNGIDLDEWNPQKDPYLPFTYHEKQLAGKAKIKAHLQKTSKLEVNKQIPVLGIVSRLTYQKGLDILIEIMPELIKLNCQIIVLGSGDKSFEASFNAFAKQYPNQVSVTIGYNEALSHLVMAGSDIFIMPSRFEPCGLNQLYGLRYGTPPVVTKTGGLADSICNTTLETIVNNKATGFVMESVNQVSLLVTIELALSVWKDKDIWKRIQINGMKKEIGWEHSANSYIELYDEVLK